MGLCTSTTGVLHIYENNEKNYMNHQVNDEYSVNLFEIESAENVIEFYKNLDESGLKFVYFRADRKRFLLLYRDKLKRGK